MAKKEGFLDRLGKLPMASILIDTGDSESSEPTPVPTTSAVVATAPAVSMPVVPMYQTTVQSNVDSETRAKIELIAKSADQVSYKKFGELLATMRATFVGDEVSAFKAALGAAGVSGYPISEIIRGLDVVLSQLNSAEEKFKQAVPARIKDKIGSRENTIKEQKTAQENTKNSIAQVKAELARLESQAVTIESNIQRETAAISQDEQTIRADEQKFLTAMQDVKTAYLNERQKLETYGRGV